jgi:hypothetical protein
MESNEEENLEEQKPERRVRSQGARNRQNGHILERYYANFFRDLHPRFEKCKTSRQASALLDASGVDLCFTDPFCFQIKHGKQKGLKVEVELEKIKLGLTKNFPAHYPEQQNMKVLIHKKDIGQGKKGSEFDEIVSMTFKDFIKLIKMINYD